MVVITTISKMERHPDLVRPFHISRCLGCLIIIDAFILLTTHVVVVTHTVELCLEFAVDNGASNFTRKLFALLLRGSFIHILCDKLTFLGEQKN